jgi:hypothetical protein
LAMFKTLGFRRLCLGLPSGVFRGGWNGPARFLGLVMTGPAA